MSIITSYLLADEEEKKRQREGYMDILRNTHTAGMLSGGRDILSSGWDKAKEIGGEWWENISSDKGEYRQEFDAKWLKKLGHSGLPRLENYIGESAEADFDRDWREYWDTHPDNLSLY